MTVRHHISEDMLSAYAAGALDEAWSLAIATHMALCAECRDASEEYDALGGVLLEDIDGDSLSADALAACLEQLDDAMQDSGAETAAAGCAVLPTPLAAYAGGNLDAVKWRSLGGGVKQRQLDVAGGATARLLWIPPGAAVPEHGHGGDEMTLVLAGSFSDGDAEFHRGDIQQADGDIEHTPTAGAGDACICLAVTDAPLRFKQILPRIIQRFARI